MDQTQLFRASVKTVRLRNRSIVQPDKSRILKTKPRDEFFMKINDVRYQVTQLRDLLLENRAAYMRFGYHLKTSDQISDEDRNIIDMESEKIITICTQYINDLKIELNACGSTNKQLLEHKLVILDSLTDYLKKVFQIHNQLKESRIQHELETYRMLKLESNKKLIPVKPPPHDRKQNEIAKYLQDDEYDSDDQPTKGDKGYYDDYKNHSNRLNISESEVAIDEDQANKYALEDETLSPDDIQMFESENKQLLNDLKGLSDEVDQIEKNVIGIARLQEIFTEKVSIQKHDIERIGNVVVGATENIKDANEQINQAIQHNAGLRVWMLFFLIVMSFTLLFLDWYND